jgi:hypothetical protein
MFVQFQSINRSSRGRDGSLEYWIVSRGNGSKKMPRARSTESRRERSKRNEKEMRKIEEK